MWTVVVEVHLPEGRGGLFQMGKFSDQNRACWFARDLEIMFGEMQVTTSVAHSSEYLDRFFAMLNRRKIRIRPSALLPPCEYDE